MENDTTNNINFSTFWSIERSDSYGEEPSKFFGERYLFDKLYALSDHR